ncbi:MAG TPA: sulfur carrier protein ThiS [Acidobacteriaceae bacterium]|nr:sulfur carrier protein ThiS [Acidobacteriaceae bacterium]
MQLLINGQSRDFAQLAEGSSIDDLIASLGLKGDRVAVEFNGAIVSRGEWPKAQLANGDKLEIVHFVGGGSIANE